MSRSGPLVPFDEPVHAVVDVVLVVAEHVDHGLGRGVDEPLIARLLGVGLALLVDQQPPPRRRARCASTAVTADADDGDEHCAFGLPAGRRADRARRPAPRRCGRLDRDADRAPRRRAVAGPAAREARRRRAAASSPTRARPGSSRPESCRLQPFCSRFTPAVDPSSGRPTSPRAATLSVPPAKTPVPRRGRRTHRSSNRTWWSPDRWPAAAHRRRAVAARPGAGGRPARAPRRATALGRAARAPRARTGRTAARSDRAARRTATAAAARGRSAARAAGTARSARAPARAARPAATARTAARVVVGSRRNVRELVGRRDVSRRS